MRSFIGFMVLISGALFANKLCSINQSNSCCEVEFKSNAGVNFYWVPDSKEDITITHIRNEKDVGLNLLGGPYTAIFSLCYSGDFFKHQVDIKFRYQNGFETAREEIVTVNVGDINEAL